MTIAHCPECREQVTVPAGVQREAVVQCPLCKEEFPLGDVLSQLPPELIVVRTVPDAVAEHPEAVPLAPPITVTYDESSDSAETAADETYAPAFQFEGAPASRRATRAIRNGRGRQPAGPLRHFVQIVLGGVVGIALAQVILWWIPANLSVSNRDLTGLGRKYGNYVPFLVPASIREEGSQQESTRIASSESPAKSSSQRPAPRKPSGRKSDIPDFPFAEAHLQGSAQQAGEKESKSIAPEASVPNGSAPDGSASQLSQQPPARPNDELEDIAVAAAKDSGSPSADRSDATAIRRSNDGRQLPIDIPTVEPAAPAEATAPQFSTDLAPPSSVPTSPPDIVPPDGSGIVLKRRFADALAASDALDAHAGRNVEETRRLAANFYRNLAALGDAIAKADPADAQATETAEDAAALLRRIAGRSERVDLIAGNTRSWLASRRTNDGVCLVGKVKNLAIQGRLFEAQVELEDGRQIAVLSRRNPTAALAAGSRVLVLGSLVESPAQSVPGYEGHAPTAVLDAAYVAIP